ncbi:MipA/OmpV family protein [Pseudomonas sp. NPDC088368]|jgi:outer membrane scaffolding protein for murein synthesis (MipA/OmpV family)|uniref:MipA/OmpV family protein n=1 Tax=Pseudomonas sp. NPDC088368 TaxID=3364453 RepID=UPI00381DB987
MTLLPTCFKRRLCTVGLLCAAYFSPVCHADSLSGDAGVGVAYQPHDRTGTRYETRPIPYLDLSWGRVNLSSDEGLSWDALKANGWSAGPFVNYVEGRTANGALHGLRDVSDMGEAGGFIEYSPSDAWRVFAEVGRTFGGSDGQGGVLGRVGGEVDYPLSHGIFGSTTLAAHYANAEQAQTFFGVTDAESRASGIRAYNASGGFQNLTFTQSVAFPIAPSWSLITSASWIHLVGSAADSSIVRQQGRVNQGELDVAVAYHFK